MLSKMASQENNPLIRNESNKEGANTSSSDENGSTSNYESASSTALAGDLAPCNSPASNEGKKTETSNECWLCGKENPHQECTVDLASSSSDDENPVDLSKANDSQSKAQESGAPKAPPRGIHRRPMSVCFFCSKAVPMFQLRHHYETHKDKLWCSYCGKHYNGWMRWVDHLDSIEHETW